MGGASPDRAMSLVVVVGAIAPTVGGTVLGMMLIVPVHEEVESVLSDEEVESEGRVTVSEIHTSGSVLQLWLVGLLVLVMLVRLVVLIVVLGVMVSGTVGAGFSRVGLPDESESAVGPAILLKSGNSLEPLVLTVLRTTVKTVVPVLNAVVVRKSPVSLVLVK